MTISKPIIALSIFVAALALSYFLVWPKYVQFQKLQSSLGVKSAEYSGKFDYYSQVAAVYRDIQSRADDLAKIDTALPTESSFGALEYFFQKKSAESGLIMKNAVLSRNTAVGKASGSLKEIVFSLDLVGSYQGLKTFFDALEKSSRIFETQSLSFTAQKPSEKIVKVQGSKTQAVMQPTYPFKLEVKTYSY